MAETREAKKKRQCSKCKITMIESVNFYNTKRLDLYPDGVLDECRKCFTMHVNIHEPSTFLGLLEKLDMPYIEGEWKRLVENYGDESTATAIFGRYIAKMKLNQFKDKGFADTEKYIAEQEMRDLREKAEKLDKINKYRMAQETGSAVAALEEIDINSLTKEEKESLFLSPEDLFEDEEDVSSFALEDDLDSLTKDDKKYLIQKWGRTYTIPECIKLEKLYIEMMESYDIRTASHFDYLLKICRVSLKIDQALEVNDIDGFQKMTKIYDLLMKSAKFTAAQNKETAEDYTDSVGVLMALCEQEGGFLPTFHNEENKDVVDYTLKDMNNYTRELVMNEANLGNMIEIYMNKMKAEEEREEDEMTNEEDEDLVFVAENEEILIEDSDYEDFNDMISEEAYEDSIKEALENT